MTIGESIARNKSQKMRIGKSHLGLGPQNLVIILKNENWGYRIRSQLGKYLIKAAISFKMNVVCGDKKSCTNTPFWCNFVFIYFSYKVI